MVMERNQFITSMKSEIYRKEYRNDTERVDLQTQLHHKEKTVKALEVMSLLRIGKESKINPRRFDVCEQSGPKGRVFSFNVWRFLQ